MMKLREFMGGKLDFIFLLRCLEHQTILRLQEDVEATEVCRVPLTN